MSIPAISVCIALFAFCIWLRRKTTSRALPLPPSPPADPLIGHLRAIPRDNKEVVFYEWGRHYGDVMYLNSLGNSLIVLNSVQAAVDLLEKRSSIYSDRPKFVIYELMGWVPDLAFIPYGQQFRKHRKLFHSHLLEKDCLAFQPLQTQNAHILVNGLLENKGDYDIHFSRFSTSIIIRVAYGHQILSDDDEYVKIANDSAAALAAGGAPGGTLVDLFPWLQYMPSWFPGTHYANVARSTNRAIRRPHMKIARNKWHADGTAEPCFLVSLLETLSNQETLPAEEDIEDIKGAAGTMYAAGAETTWSSLVTFTLAMILFPECQRRAWREIDNVTRGERLPEFADKPNLPYVECVVQEVLRWYPAVPLGIPHRSIKDDIYKGMLIPQGSIVFANALGMARDEDTYSNPTAFNPSRFLPESEGGNGEPYLEAAFGFGRRICPGRHLASASLWIAIASILATLEILAPRDELGQEVLPDVEYISGITSRPKPFVCNFKPRNKTTEQLILQASPNQFQN